MILRLLLVIFLLSSCIDPIEFNVGHTNIDLLIVNGFISNEEETYTVILSRSAKYTGVLEGGFNKPETKAIVKIVDNEGNEEVLHEKTKVIPIWEYDINGDVVNVEKTVLQKGIYVTNPGFQGQFGKTYHLYIKLTDGKEYKSIPEFLEAPTATVDSLYYVHETHQQLNEYNHFEEKKGFQFYTAISTNQKNRHYKYEWEGTYILETPLEHSPSVPNICYVTEKDESYLKLLSTSDFSKQKISAIPLNFMELNYKYNIKYSYNLKQYAISENAYTFFKLVKRQLNSTGSIFDPIPSKISGNIYNINDSDEIVLGYFGVYGLTKKRVFIARTDMPESFTTDSLTICFDPPPFSPPPDYCSDCTLLPGSSQVKPDFWE